MRYGKWLAGLVLALGLATSASAQVNNASFGGIDPRQLQYQGVNTSNSVVPIAQPMFFNHTFSLANYLPNLSSFSANPIIGQSQYPTTVQPDASFFAPFGMMRLRPLNVPY